MGRVFESLTRGTREDPSLMDYDDDNSLMMTDESLEEYAQYYEETFKVKHEVLNARKEWK